MERAHFHVVGIVQGVGFRPFVHGLASRLGLGGWVLNRAGTVDIEVEGPAPALERFARALQEEAPPLALIDTVQRTEVVPLGETEVVILPSDASEQGQIFVSADVAPCAACLAEMRNPDDRRYGYPFLNCTHCGPRLTIIEGSPYDRERTAMKAFPMCAECRAEYEDPSDRRFHAEPTACPVCGPQVFMATAPEAGGDAIAEAAAALLGGSIGAIKGLGGYHLACDATRVDVVRTLRQRKHRDEKPLALMVPDLEAARRLCRVGDAEAELLESPRRPIVLLRRLSDADIARGVAPGNPYLGVMLPYTPEHHLIMDAVGGRPLVMTSGNLSDEPIAHEDDDARRRLSDIADFFLLHDRDIRVRCDDSVYRVLAGEPLPVRRSRGYAPQPLTLPHRCPQPILAVGGMLKNTFALGRGGYGFLSHHVGDLDEWNTFLAFRRAVDHYEELLGISPALIVHDAHPGYDSTRFAIERGRALGLPTLAVQHHHAHLAACLADNAHPGPALGVSFDGTGYGDDGAIWGGEVLVGGYAGYERGAHLAYVAMPGGERAIHEPWRMALAHLLAAGASDAPVARWAEPRQVHTCRTMIQRGLNAPLTSSMGRLFDAVAALAGVRGVVSYEGQAAMELEWRADGQPLTSERDYAFALHRGRDDDAPLVMDPAPVIRAVVQDVASGVDPSTVSARFHAAVANVVAQVCTRLRDATGIGVVALSGGVFLNARLVETLLPALAEKGFEVLRHRRVPPGDGGLSLGQLAVAAAGSAGG